MGSILLRRAALALECERPCVQEACGAQFHAANLPAHGIPWENPIRWVRHGFLWKCSRRARRSFGQEATSYGLDSRIFEFTAFGGGTGGRFNIVTAAAMAGSHPGTPAKGVKLGERGNFNPVVSISGLAGTIFSTLCCIGIAPLIALVSTIGLGFILTLSILLPMLAVFLGLGCLSMWFSKRRHGVAYPMILHCAAAVPMVVLIAFRYHIGPWLWIAMAVLMVSTVWNIRLEYAYWHREPEVHFPPTT